jgi:uroporphyrinogen-III synthase
MPLSKYHLLCTRPLEQLLINKASEKGMGIDIVPFIKTEPIVSPEIIRQIEYCQSQKINVVFTSINAVTAVAVQLTSRPDWTIYSLGGITKETVYRYFSEKSVVATAKNATALAEKIVLRHPMEEVVFFCGDQRLNELPETLLANHIPVKEIAVYTTIETPQPIEKNYSGILFFSPSAVHSFFSVNTINTNVILFSIGKTTTATIRSYCTNTVETSEWPGKQQMIERVIAYFEKI